MPKDVHNRHGGSSERNRYKAYEHSSRRGKRHDSFIEEDAPENSSGKNDWEDAICPICMEVPHNAVLLFCSSHDKGCRPYMCNTSHRHSNCLDQYQKAGLGAQGNYTLNERLPTTGPVVGRASTNRNSDSVRTRRRSVIGEVVDTVTLEAARSGVEIEAGLTDSSNHADDPDQLHAMSSCLQGKARALICPLCRGDVEGWEVIHSAREHLNHKIRSCAQEGCPFSGKYEELRAHTRREHPFARPSEIDPVRQRAWRRLERRRDLGDVMSTMLPGSAVVGDAMIDAEMEEEEDAVDFPGDDGHWWTVFLLFQVFGPATSMVSESSPRHNGRSRASHRDTSGEGLSRSRIRQMDGSSEDSDAAETARRSARRRRRSAENAQ